MSTHTLHSEINETYFCTLTCYKWKSLFEEANAYSAVYTWFEHLKRDNCHIIAYVIMPNHLHCLVTPTKPQKTLNKLVSEGKRFMAYAIVKNLIELRKWSILEELEAGVQESERRKSKKHQVFRLSFDARQCHSEKMLEQKLDYIHTNPVKGKWSLVDDFTDYPHSSASFYELQKGNKFITHYKDLMFEK